MFHHPAWAVGSYSSGPPAARSAGTKSTIGFPRPLGPPCTDTKMLDKMTIFKQALYPSVYMRRHFGGACPSFPSSLDCCLSVCRPPSSVILTQCDAKLSSDAVAKKEGGREGGKGAFNRAFCPSSARTIYQALCDKISADPNLSRSPVGS